MRLVNKTHPWSYGKSYEGRYKNCICTIKYSKDLYTDENSFWYFVFTHKECLISTYNSARYCEKFATKEACVAACIQAIDKALTAVKSKSAM